MRQSSTYQELGWLVALQIHLVLTLFWLEWVCRDLRSVGWWQECDRDTNNHRSSCLTNHSRWEFDSPHLDTRQKHSKAVNVGIVTNTILLAIAAQSVYSQSIVGFFSNSRIQASRIDHILLHHLVLFHVGRLFLFVKGKADSGADDDLASKQCTWACVAPFTSAAYDIMLVGCSRCWLE